MLRRQLAATVGVPATDANSIEVLRDGDAIFDSMVASIDEAADSIELVIFVYGRGEPAVRLTAALTAARRRGVRTRVLVDRVGGRTLDSAFRRSLVDAGVDFRWFHGLDDRDEVGVRNHRKVLVCDSTVAHTGGMGIDESWASWRDYAFRVRGPAVDGLRAAFETSWIETTGSPVDVIPVDQGAPGDLSVTVLRSQRSAGPNHMAVLFAQLILAAEERLWITTGFLNPDEVMADQLTATARRGVDVRLLIPGPGAASNALAELAGEDHYERLLDAGIRIWWFTDTMLHAKVVTVDGAICVVGSANLNLRSLDRDDEVALVVHDDAFCARLDGEFEANLDSSTWVDPERWADRSLRRKLLASAVQRASHRI